MTAKQIERIRNRNLNKNIDPETRKLIRIAATGRTVSANTRKKMSENNNKSTPIVAYDVKSSMIYKEFKSMADVALHFFDD